MYPHVFPFGIAAKAIERNFRHNLLAPKLQFKCAFSSRTARGSRESRARKFCILQNGNSCTHQNILYRLSGPDFAYRVRNRLVKKVLILGEDFKFRLSVFKRHVTKRAPPDNGEM